MTFIWPGQIPKSDGDNDRRSPGHQLLKPVDSSHPIPRRRRRLESELKIPKGAAAVHAVKTVSINRFLYGSSTSKSTLQRQPNRTRPRQVILWQPSYLGLSAYSHRQSGDLRNVIHIKVR